MWHKSTISLIETNFFENFNKQYTFLVWFCPYWCEGKAFLVVLHVTWPLISLVICRVLCGWESTVFWNAWESIPYLSTRIPFHVHSGIMIMLPEASSFIFRVHFICKIRLTLLMSLKQVSKITNFVFNSCLPKEYNGSNKTEIKVSKKMISYRG